MPEIQLHLERPRADAPSSLRPRGDGYACSYALSGAPGATLLQAVRVEVAYTRGGRTLVSYSGSYLEYFLLDASGQTQLDTHDLSLARDGWDRAAMRRLLTRHGFSAGGEESRLRCVKTFLLGLGAVEGAAAHSGPPERAFGFLAAGPAQVEACVTVSSADGSAQATLLPKSPCPFGYRPQGHGEFLEPPAWRAREVFDYSYTTRSGHLDEGGGYAPCLGPLAPCPAPEPELPGGLRDQ